MATLTKVDESLHKNDNAPEVMNGNSFPTFYDVKTGPYQIMKHLFLATVHDV